MKSLLWKLTYAAWMVAVALTISPALALGQNIYPTEGGRTTLTLSKPFLADIAAIGATPTAIAGSQLYNNKISFSIASGAISLDSATGQVLHAGGLTIAAGKKDIRLDSFMLTTLGEQSYVSALVVSNGKFLGRVNVFDITLPSDLKLPLAPNDGDFFLGGVQWNLDPAGAAALNDTFDTKAFKDDMFIGDSLSLVFVPLAADAATVTPGE